MEWDLINYFSEKLYIEHKNQSLILIKEKVFSLRVHQNLKTTTNEIGKRKIILVKSQLTPTTPPHSIQWSVISPRHFLPRPLLPSRNGAKKFFETNFRERWNMKVFPKCQKAWNLSLLKREDGDSQPSWLWFLFILGSVWILIDLDYLDDCFNLLILITSNLKL